MRIGKSISWLRIMVVLSVLLLMSGPVLAAKVVIVTKQDVPEFNAHAEHVSGLLSPTHDVTILHLDLTNDSTTLQQVISATPDVVVCVGSKTTQSLSRGLPTQIPMVYSLVVNPEHLMPRPLRVGRVVDVPISKRLEILTQLFPNMSRVGVLEGPLEDPIRVKRYYARLSRELGLKLFMEPVARRGELQSVLDTLFSNRVEAVVSTPKARIYSASDMRYLILFLSRYRVPYLALSSAYLDSGALFSVDADLDAESYEVAKLVEQVLKHPQLKGVQSVGYPEKFHYTINGSVLRKFRFRLTQRAIDGAREVRE